MFKNFNVLFLSSASINQPLHSFPIPLESINCLNSIQRFKVINVLLTLIASIMSFIPSVPILFSFKASDWSVLFLFNAVDILFVPSGSIPLLSIISRWNILKQSSSNPLLFSSAFDKVLIPPVEILLSPIVNRLNT